MACEECNVWQHSSCLGISQADAEKEDFHFVCSDCKRKMEDAKKPKIPPLKFKVGSSSSPPADKSTIYVNGDNQSKKRKSSESEHDTTRMPPIKMFKPYFAPPTAKGVRDSNLEQSAKSDRMHQSFMTGPTLAPQGQLPSPQGTNGYHVPPPGLVSPARPISYSNGAHHDHLFTSSSSNQSQSSLANGTGLNGEGFSGAVRPNGYPTALSPQTSQYEKRQLYSTGSPNPFHNSFDRQHPVSSHLPNDIVSPSQDRSSIAPAQGNSNVVSLSFSPSVMIAPNGTGLSPYRPASATHPSAYFPQKLHNSPSTATPFTSSSSPLIPPPVSPSNISVSGLSPSKNSPPRPPPIYGVSRTPIMPPAAHLFPSPQPQTLYAPVKSMTPEQIKMANGQGQGE